MLSESIFNAVKVITQMAASSGTGLIVGNLVKATTPDDISRIMKLRLAVGGWALAGTLGGLVAGHVGKQIDQTEDSFNKIFHPPVPIEEESEEPETAVESPIPITKKTKN